jgi:hypothetical protein
VRRNARAVHHSPVRTDAELDEIAAWAQQLAGDLSWWSPREGSVLEVAQPFCRKPNSPTSAKTVCSMTYRR